MKINNNLIQQSFSFHGRLNRLQFLSYLLLNWFLCFLVGLIYIFTNNILVLILTVPIIYVHIGCIVKRMRDSGLKWWLGFIPYIGFIFQWFPTKLRA